MGTKYIQVQKTWGREFWLVNTEKYCAKILRINKGKHCSLHYHLEKDETFFISEGTVVVIYGFHDPGDGKIYMVETLNKGDSIHITPGMRHMFYGVTKAKILEISTHHKENDVVRCSDGKALIEDCFRRDDRRQEDYDKHEYERMP